MLYGGLADRPNSGLLMVVTLLVWTEASVKAVRGKVGLLRL